MDRRFTVAVIPPHLCKEKKYVYMRYLGDNSYSHYKKGDIVKFNLLTWRAAMDGFRYEEGYVEPVSNVEKLLLDAGKMKYKVGNDD